MKKIISIFALLFCSLVSGAAIGPRTVFPELPQWFWVQSSEGFLGPNVAVQGVRWFNPKHTLGWRFVCWKSQFSGMAGIAVPAMIRVGDLLPTDFQTLDSNECDYLKALGY